MRKTLAAANRGERVPFKIPRSVQQSIPIQRVWQDGIWQVNGRFSQTWRFADINYSLASYEDQRDMFTSYCGVLNSLPTDAVTKITIHNRRLNSSDFQHSVLMRECGDDLDLYRREYNRVLTEKAAASNNLIQDKYITVSVARKNAEEARAFFHRVDADLSKNLGRLDSGAKALDTYERLLSSSTPSASMGTWCGPSGGSSWRSPQTAATTSILWKSPEATAWGKTRWPSSPNC